MRNLSVKNNMIVIIISIAFFFSLLVFLRGKDFDHDYQTYLDLYTAINTQDFQLTLGSIEPGYYFLMWIFKSIGLSFDSLFFSITFLCLIFKYYSVSKFDYTTLFVYIILYGSSFFLLHELNQTRIAITTTFFYLIAYKLYKYDPKEKIGISFLLFAPLFHFSSIILFISIVKNKISTILIWLSLTIFLVYFLLAKFNFFEITYLFSFILDSDRTKGYLFEVLDFENNSLKIFNGANIVYLFYIISARLISNIYQFEKNNNRLIAINELMVIISVIVFIVFKNSPVVATRLAELLRIFTPLVLAILISKLMTKGFIAAVVGFSYFVIIISINLILYGPTIHPINKHLLSPFGLSRYIGA